MSLQHSWHRSAALLLAAIAITMGGLMGCSVFSERPPVPDDTLVEVLTEMHLVAARYTVQDSLPPGLRDSVLAHHGLSHDEFDAALAYYSRHPEAYKTVQESVVDSLSALNATLQNAEPPEQRSSIDSLRLRR